MEAEVAMEKSYSNCNYFGNIIVIIRSSAVDGGQGRNQHQ